MHEGLVICMIHILSILYACEESIVQLMRQQQVYCRGGGICDDDPDTRECIESRNEEDGSNALNIKNIYYWVDYLGAKETDKRS